MLPLKTPATCAEPWLACLYIPSQHIPRIQVQETTEDDRRVEETTEDRRVEGSRSYQTSVTPLFRGTKAPKTHVLLCFGSIREGRMIHDRSLLTS